MKNSQTNIRKLARKYREWLTNQPSLASQIDDQEACLSYLDAIITRKADTAASLWDAIIDHIQETPWDADELPELLANLHEMIDEYRLNRNVDSTNYANLLSCELRKEEHRATPAQVVISQYYERLTGDTLQCETDPINGESFFYKGRDHGDFVTSIGLHPEVIEFFGLIDSHMRIDGNSLFFACQDNVKLANALMEHQQALFY